MLSDNITVLQQNISKLNKCNTNNTLYIERGRYSHKFMKSHFEALKPSTVTIAQF